MPKHSNKTMMEEEKAKWMILREAKVKELAPIAHSFLNSEAPDNAKHLLTRAVARRIDERYNSAASKVECINASTIPVTLDELMEAVRPAPRQELAQALLDAMLNNPSGVAKHIGKLQKALTTGTIKDLQKAVDFVQGLPISE